VIWTEWENNFNKIPLGNLWKNIFHKKVSSNIKSSTRNWLILAKAPSVAGSDVSHSWPMVDSSTTNVSTDLLNWRPMPDKKPRGNWRYAITYNVIWENQKTESFEYHWLRALAMFDVTSFPAILSGIERHFKLCRYVNVGLLRSKEVGNGEPRDAAYWIDHHHITY